MAASLIDPLNDPLHPDYVEPAGEKEPVGPNLGNLVAEGQVVQQPTSTGFKLDPEQIPEAYREKYGNKTDAEVIDILLNQEKVIGRQGQEVGDLRSQNTALEGLVNKALEIPLAQGQPIGETKTELTDDDFALSPKESTERLVTAAVEKAVGKTNETVQNLEIATRVQQFEAIHPTATKDVNDPAFAEYVNSTPYRTRLAKTAIGDLTAIDFDAAEDLWLGWEEHRGAVKPDDDTKIPATGADPKTPTIEDASLVSGGGKAATSASDNSGKPIYSEAALQDMQLNDNDKYWRADVQAEIQAAYQEGRVRSP